MGTPLGYRLLDCISELLRTVFTVSKLTLETKLEVSKVDFQQYKHGNMYSMCVFCIMDRAVGG